MGQILGIGIVTKCGTYKEQLQKNNISIDELIAEMKKKQHFEPAIYDLSEEDDYYMFHLKQDIIKSQLLPFLEKFYPKVYYGKKVYYEEIIEELKNSEPTTWLELADKKSWEAYQLDKYAMRDYLYFDKPFKPYTEIFYTTILLSHEGKIGMEVHGRQFNFFKYCIQKTFSKFQIAKALRVYISG